MCMCRVFPLPDCLQEKNMLVYVEQKALLESHLLEDKDFDKVQHKLKPFKEGWYKGISQRDLMQYPTYST